MSFRRFIIWARIDTSSAETGSSSTISLGREASAAASATRWRWPPLNSCGYCWACSGRRPTWSSSSCTRAAILAWSPKPLTISASAMVRPTFMRGLSDDQGSWNTACTLAR